MNFIKRRFFPAVLVFASLLTVISLSSCFTVEDIPQELSQKDPVIQGGDTNTIYISTSDSAQSVAAAKGLLSAVSISSTFEIEYESFWGPYVQDAKYSGSGVIYKLDKNAGDAYVITNYHVVYNSASTSENGISNDISAFLYGQETSKYAMKAEYIGGSMLYDIAVLKISGSRVLTESCAAPVSPSNSDEISVLDTAIVIGNPASLGISATTGSISVDSEYITMTAPDDKTQTAMRVIRTDAAVNGGNSGGGLFNTKGDLIGIVNAKITSSSIENIGYAIPANVAVGIAENIISQYDGAEPVTLKKCMLGITSGVAAQKAVLDSETGRIKRTETVAIADITEGGLADGILAVGDIVNSVTVGAMTVNITRAHQLSELMLSARAGDTVTFSLVREGKPLSVSITLTPECVTEIQ
ncbi:MAG: trypsin-like peptidase domain-containing protein [Clostridia bacterium]|nr:trypsin-like peptidase domain-containing protein [Clostridia bacterium]